MARMSQQEIDEISEAFLEAWADYFGDELYYVPFDYTNTRPDGGIYSETKYKKYLYDSKVLLHATVKEREDLDVDTPIGKSIEKHYEITFVTKELTDTGVHEIDTNAILVYTDRFEKEHKFHIYDDFQKVQLVDNKVFTKLKVKSYG